MKIFILFIINLDFKIAKRLTFSKGEFENKNVYSLILLELMQIFNQIIRYISIKLIGDS